MRVECSVWVSIRVIADGCRLTAASILALIKRLQPGKGEEAISVYLRSRSDAQHLVEVQVRATLKDPRS